MGGLPLSSARDCLFMHSWFLKTGMNFTFSLGALHNYHCDFYWLSYLVLSIINTLGVRRRQGVHSFNALLQPNTNTSSNTGFNFYRDHQTSHQAHIPCIDHMAPPCGEQMSLYLFYNLLLYLLVASQSVLVIGKVC